MTGRALVFTAVAAVMVSLQFSIAVESVLAMDVATGESSSAPVEPAANSESAPGDAPAEQLSESADKETAAASVAAESSAAESSAGDGALITERKELQAKIREAELAGVGIAPYMKALDGIEASARSGGSEESLRKRIDSVSRSLDDQLKRSRDLKVQRPAPPISASSPPPSSFGSGRSGDLKGLGQGLSGLGGGDKSRLIEKLKDKWFGGEIPDSIKSKIPKGFDPSSLDKETADRLMKKLGR